jgi:cytochrome c oxidase subunit 3
MQIPYEVSARPDTGLYNAKLGIWLFLASEVMLFGGLFSAYLMLRMGADPGYWPHGLLNVPIGTFNTLVLIASSVSVVFAWAFLKMRRWNYYWWSMLFTILCGVLFLTIKLSIEWPAKFEHFGVYVQKDAAGKYEDFLGNKYLSEKNLPPRYEITGHLIGMSITRDGKEEEVNLEGETPEDKGKSPTEAGKILEEKGVKLVAYKLHVDPVNAHPTDAEYDRPHFWQVPATETEAVIKADDIASASAFFPRHNTYFQTYFLITGLHGLHVLGGVIVFTYMFLFGKKLYLRNPEHMANRVEVAGLFWHFVDLVWIFVFPIFYLL